ncbi:protein translocase subunit SecF [Georgenia wangjunii]|uniref:protein translocase subunit SecF n=1 Tax=Georgenia wangjunii TaxID=3117730 RepID=UPI002F2661D1
MSKLATMGNDLHTGRRSFPIVQRGKTWLAVGGTLVLISLLLLAFKGLNAGIEFRGGSQFTITGTSTLEQQPAHDVLNEVGADQAARISTVGDEALRIQTEELTTEQTSEVRAGLAETYDVPVADVASTFIGPSWGEDITRQALQGLGIFILLVSVVLSAYFRSWKMAAAAMIALLNDLVLTVGVYALIGWEVTPATVIGLLTILGYSLYDTVVVFDKIRENSTGLLEQEERTYSEAANLAVNQTLIRSVNTSMTSLLPVGSILFVGALLLGAGTLRDIALALFVGMLVSTLSSIFIAAPVQAALHEREDTIKEHTARVLDKRRARAERAAATSERASAGAEHGTQPAPPVTGEAVVAGHHRGNVAQPRRKKGRR